MKKLTILLQLCYKFSKNYMVQYIFELSKPLLIGILGLLLFALILINPIFALISFLSIPCICYAIWKGYVITYGLISCADNYLKNSALPFKNFSDEAQKEEKELVKFVGFMAILSLILLLPTFIYSINQLAPLITLSQLEEIEAILDNITNAFLINKIMNVFLINSLIISPFLNYFLCTFYYRKEKESYFSLFFNCVKKLDILGLTIALFITLISIKGGIIYFILAIILNPFIYSINTFWYSAKIRKQEPIS